MAIPLTADFIRGLCGLSAAELPDTTIDSLHVIEIAEAAELEHPDLSEHEGLYYKGWKAITLLAPSFYLLVPEKIKDNFNEFSRFDNIQDLLDYAFAAVAAVENPQSGPIDQMHIAPPEQDPVTGEIVR
jgi:hypothetical protein